MDNTAIYSGDARTDNAVILVVDDYFDSTEFAGLMGKAAAEAGNALVSDEPPGNVPYYYFISNGNKELTNVENRTEAF